MKCIKTYFKVERSWQEVARKRTTSGNTRKSRSMSTPESELNRIVGKALDLVEKRIDEGTATSQETTTLIKYGSEKARLEQERIRYEIEYLKAKSDALASTKRSEELFEEAIKAMRSYNGITSEEE